MNARSESSPSSRTTAVAGVSAELFFGRRGVARPFVVLATAFLLSSCAVGPNFETPGAPGVTSYLSEGAPGADGVPGRQVVRGGDIPARWWELFHSQHLNDLVEQGIAFNADLQAAEAAVRIAQANANAQRGALFPTAVANFDVARQQNPGQSLATPDASGADLFTLHTAQVTVSYAPDVFGGVRRQIENLDALAEVSAFQREGVYLTLTSNILLAAIQEGSLRGQIAATRRLISIQSQLLDLLRQQNTQGQIALPDVAAQETAVAQARLLLPPLERQLAQQRDLLAALTGRFPSETIAATFQLGSFRLPRKLPLSVPADLVRQRPDIRAAEANLRATNAQIGVAIANRLPAVTLTGNIGSTSTEIATLFGPGTGFWSLAGNVAHTIFDAGTLASKQRAAEESYNQTVAQYRSTMLTAFQNVADTLRALQSDARAVNAAIAAEQAAKRNIDLVQRQVQQGQVSVPTLLIVQQAYLQTALAHVQADAARLADTVALFQALGGGWWNKPELALPETALAQ